MIFCKNEACINFIHIFVLIVALFFGFTYLAKIELLALFFCEKFNLLSKLAFPLNLWIKTIGNQLLNQRVYCISNIFVGLDSSFQNTLNDSSRWLTHYSRWFIYSSNWLNNNQSVFLVCKQRVYNLFLDWI